MVPCAFRKVTDAFQHGVDLFNRCAFFECHEALEEIWMPEHGPRRLFLQSLIHVAVGFHHHQNGNQHGAERQLQKGLKKLAGYLPEFEGVQTQVLYWQALESLARIRRGIKLTDFPRVILCRHTEGSP
jgi:predicted metal-dependent hydrolase